MLLIEKIRKEIGDPPKNQNRYTNKQELAFKLAVEAESKRIKKEAEPWMYIAVPHYAGGPTGGITWVIFTSACKQYNNNRESIHRFTALFEEAAINLAADLSAAAQIRKFRDEDLGDHSLSGLDEDLVQIESPEPQEDFLLSSTDSDDPKTSSPQPPPK